VCVGYNDWLLAISMPTIFCYESVDFESLSNLGGSYPLLDCVLQGEHCLLLGYLVPLSSHEKPSDSLK
jgi:hypothetical protein